MKPVANTIDEYIAAAPDVARATLSQLRNELVKLLPTAKEKIAYGIPSFVLSKNVIHFAGYQNHIGLYPGSKAIAFFAEELKPYKTSKGTIQLALNEELPINLIKKIVEFCVAEIKHNEN